MMEQSEIIDGLETFIALSMDEVTETCEELIRLTSSSDYLSDEFNKALAQELRSQLVSLQDEYTVEERIQRRVNMAKLNDYIVIREDSNTGTYSAEVTLESAGAYAEAEARRTQGSYCIYKKVEKISMPTDVPVVRG